ncbi:MAG: glycyl-radical enzyme activating protein [Clostridiales Family XIII bacterium]|jgi:pyruvate formate lyase activating enzyme|nr:glycyl-radical enzyme activating protein [Clostridiales Family XIII bacterium]
MSRLVGRVFDIQRYSTHDGPGIRTVVFFKGCPLRCKWCSNPESQRCEPDIFFREQTCLGCGRCVKVCPFHIPVGGQGADAKCTYCGNCVRECPAKALELKGVTLTVDEVIDEVERDAAFYSASGGGVTLSGGEPLMQPEFAEALAREARDMGYRLAIETTGYAAWDDVKRVFDHVDLVLYDVKHASPAMHEEGTGVTNDLIIDNLRKSVEEGYNIVVRAPFIGGFNTASENIEHTAELLGDVGIGRVDILPYHTYGDNKYKMLRREYAFNGRKPTEEEIGEFRELCAEKNIKARVE